VRRSSLVVVGLGLALAAGPAALRSGAAPTAARETQISARIDVGGRPFSVATGAGSVWVLDRPLAGCSPRRVCRVLRIDPRSNRVVGKTTRLHVDAWTLAVGGSSVWVTRFDGRLVRIDARTGRIAALLSARPTYFGSVVAFGGGFVWTGNDDERNAHGSVSKIDPRTNRVVATVGGLGSPQSIGFGAGAIWVADHDGWLVKIDPRTVRVVARHRLDFAPHGVVATTDAVFVADAHGSRILEADPETAKTRRVVSLPIGPIYPAVGAGWLWTSSAATWEDPSTKDDRVVRIDPATLRVVETLHLDANVAAVAFGFGSVWATLPTGQVVRLSAK
jgi:virginiamycin B lyase